MRRLKGLAIHRFREKASVFLTELHPTRDALERATVLALLRKRDFEATHHCSAWREGVPISAFGADDDGEPSGTAGRPMLAVLEGAQVTDLIAVCIRWYGGTKLGTGGLVRAYTEGVQGALAVADATGLWEEVRILRSGEIRVPATQAHLPFALLGAFPASAVVAQTFLGEEACLRFECPPDLMTALDHAWRERSRGGVIRWE
jgi:putative IMPACT (imprinted ancient) family translation regulator